MSFTLYNTTENALLALITGDLPESHFIVIYKAPCCNIISALLLYKT